MLKRGNILLTGLLLLMAVCGLTACSQDDALDEESWSGGLQVMGLTRADMSATPVSDAATAGYSSIKLFLANRMGTTSGNFSYKDNCWKSSMQVEAGTSYNIYGYTPLNAATGTLTNATDVGATLTLSDVSTVQVQDVCVVVGVQQLDTPSDAADLRQGMFAFTGKAEGENFVRLLIDHVMASVHFQMTLDSEYALLRSIKLKRMELSATAGRATITVPLTHGTGNVSPIGNVTYATSGSSASAVFFSSNEGVTLSDTRVTEANCCFVPTLSSALTLTTTYEVYDRKGHFIGERTASNKLNLNASRGQRIALNLVISPTYLNVLSAPDLDFPDITIN